MRDMPENPEARDAITIEHLVKRYRRGQQNAVDDISFRVRRGETFGLLGPNGAGKTTTIGILTTLTALTSGRASIGGVDVARNPIGVKQRIAIVPQRNNLDRSLRVVEILTFHAAYHGVPKAQREARADALLEEFGLADRRNQKLGWLSGGLEQRVMLVRALMHDPEVLFLDEPTNNLDPQARLFLWERIQTLHARGVTIVLTTHDMEEADRLCGRIAIMDHGRVLALDTPERLKRLIPGGTMLELHLRAPEAVYAGIASSETSAPRLGGDHFQRLLEGLPDVARVEPMGDAPADEEDGPPSLGYRVYASGNAGALLASAAQSVIQEHAELVDLRFARPSLEDVFIHLTGRKLRS